MNESDGEVVVFGAKRWDHRSREELTESAIPCHDPHVGGDFTCSNLYALTVLVAKSQRITLCTTTLSWDK